MPLFRRGAARGATDQPARWNVPAGTLPCSEQGCPNQTGVQCAYVDRRRRHCNHAFCPDHWAVIGGVVYCRRHYGTIAAIGSQPDPQGFPDLENRSPSLVRWVSRDLESWIKERLQEMARPGEHLVEEPGVRITYDRTRVRRFERSWRLVDHTGVSIQVTIFVTEDDDTTVHIRIGAGVVAEGVPPWIERRRRHIVVSEEVDQAQRQMFYEFLKEHITGGLNRVRALDQRYG